MNRYQKLAGALGLLLVTGTVWAHPGHGQATFLEGLSHPFGADHLLAMLAVGLWSSQVLPKGRQWLGPVLFLLSLAAGAGLAWSGLLQAPAEPAVAASVALFGLMLSAGRKLPAAAGLTLVVAAGLSHGQAHGSESLSGALPLAFGFGMLLMSALLHGIGLRLGGRIAILSPSRRETAWQGLAGGLGAAGLFLLTRV